MAIVGPGSNGERDTDDERTTENHDGVTGGTHNHNHGKDEEQTNSTKNE